MAKADVRKLFATLLHEIGGIAPETIRDDAAIDGDLELNSVTFVELQVALEDELDIIPPLQEHEPRRQRWIHAALACSAAASGCALSRISSYSRRGSESATIPPPEW